MRIGQDRLQGRVEFILFINIQEIAGGRDKGLDFTSLKEVVADKVKLAVLIGEAQGKMWRAWSKAAPCVRAFSMEEAVRLRPVMPVGAIRCCCRRRVPALTCLRTMNIAVRSSNGTSSTCCEVTQLNLQKNDRSEQQYRNERNQ